MVTRRLLGTHVYLYDANGTIQIADCGKITEVDTENINNITSQTYTLPCNSSQLASYVQLEDSEIEESVDAGEDLLTIMNIAEVTVYRYVRCLNTGKLGKYDGQSAYNQHRILNHCTGKCPVALSLRWQAQR